MTAARSTTPTICAVRIVHGESGGRGLDLLGKVDDFAVRRDAARDGLAVPPGRAMARAERIFARGASRVNSAT